MKESLDPTKPGQKGIVLYGIGGSGKTQLARQFIELHRQDYCAIFWINASTNDILRETFTEAANAISAKWPKDLPNTYSGSDPGLAVKSRLRSTTRRKWLLIYDSLDNLNSHDYIKYVPDCQHGSRIITTTNARAVEIFGLEGLEIDRLNTEHGCQLLATRSKRIDSSNKLSLNGRLMA